MFCYQCGSCLSEDARFCPSCGASVECGSGTGFQGLPAAVRTGMVAIPILGQPAYFDETIEIYVGLRQTFLELAEELAQAFADEFYSKYQSMDIFIRNFPKDLQDIFEEAADVMHEALSEMKIFGVTQEELAPYREKYCYRTFLEINRIRAQYQAIVDRQEEMENYRQVRKDSRGRLVGGGFGLKGAAKGIVTAGAVNMATGTIHSLGNALGSVGTAISTANAKDRLLKSGIVSQLEYAIEADVLGVHLVMSEIITARTGRPFCKFTEEAKEQANKILNDLERSLISVNSEREAVIRMLTLYPFEPYYYHVAVRSFPNEIKNMQEFACFLGFDIDGFYRNMKEQADPAVKLLIAYKNAFHDLLIDDLDLDEEDVEPLTTDLPDMAEYFGWIFEGAFEKGFFFLPSEGDTARSRLHGARSTYANYGNEIPLLLYDATLGKSGKEGFLVTNKHLYIGNGSKAIKLMLSTALADIRQGKDESNNCNYLYFGAFRVHLLNAGDMVKKNILEDFIALFMSLVLFLTQLRPAEEDLWSAITQYQHLPPAKKGNRSASIKDDPDTFEHTSVSCYCFECGAENEVGDRFCCDCGAELI